MSIIGNTIAGASAGAKFGTPGIVGGAAIGLVGTALEEYYQPSLQKAALQRAGATPQTAIGKIEAPQPSDDVKAYESIAKNQNISQQTKNAQQAYEQQGQLFPYQYEMTKAQNEIAQQQELQAKLKTQYDKENYELQIIATNLGIKGQDAVNKKVKAEQVLVQATTTGQYIENKNLQKIKDLEIKKRQLENDINKWHKDSLPDVKTQKHKNTFFQYMDCLTSIIGLGSHGIKTTSKFFK